MSHNIGYLTCTDPVNKASVIADIAEIAERDGDGYASHMTWHDSVQPFETEEEAHEFIKAHDNGWYDDHAVRFYDYSKAQKTPKIAELEARANELMKAKMQYIKDHSVQRLQAKYIGCPKCGSRLSKSHLRGAKCPLCYTDLRSETTIKKIEWYEQKIEDCRKRQEAERMKQKKSRRVMWLVKYEYHS